MNICHNSYYLLFMRAPVSLHTPPVTQWFTPLTIISPHIRSPQLALSLVQSPGPGLWLVRSCSSVQSWGGGLEPCRFCLSPLPSVSELIQTSSHLRPLVVFVQSERLLAFKPICVQSANSHSGTLYLNAQFQLLHALSRLEISKKEIDIWMLVSNWKQGANCVDFYPSQREISIVNTSPTYLPINSCQTVDTKCLFTGHFNTSLSSNNFFFQSQNDCRVVTLLF